MKFSLVLVLILLLAMAACPFACAPLDRLVHGSPPDTSAATAKDVGSTLHAETAPAPADGNEKRR